MIILPFFLMVGLMATLDLTGPKIDHRHVFKNGDIEYGDTNANYPGYNPPNPYTRN